MEAIKISTRLTSEERETILNYDSVDKKWYADTTVLKHYNRFVKQGWTLIEQYIYEDGSIAGGTFEAPERAITIRNTEKKEMSNKQMNNLSSVVDDID